MLAQCCANFNIGDIYSFNTSLWKCRTFNCVPSRSKAYIASKAPLRRTSYTSISSGKDTCCDISMLPAFNAPKSNKCTLPLFKITTKKQGVPFAKDLCSEAFDETPKLLRCGSGGKKNSCVI